MIVYFASSVIEEPILLTIASVGEVSLAILKAFMLSKVSPDCEMNTTRVSSSKVSAVYLNSEARTTSVFIFAKC